ncbi:nuclear protein localization protein 4, partial [Blyttiomyces sp. JEL0837]
MIIRIRSPEGQSRLDVPPNTDMATFCKQVADMLKISPGQMSLSADQQGKQTLPSGGPIPLKHGDMVFVTIAKDAIPEPEPSANARPAVVNHSLVKQAPIDDFMEKQKGTIKRKKDATLHGDSGMCDYCMPLEPYDAKYLEENKIKHMSFHAYLRQAIAANKTPSPSSPAFLPPLDEPDFKLISPCPSKSHAPYPAGICSKCQPSAVTLQSQNFRMVDHVEFESAGIIENFIGFWRQTAYQRFGFMYGRYEPYSEVPLGIKAVVSAIYEPPQDNSHDTIQLTLPNVQEANASEVAKKLGLEL